MVEQKKRAAFDEIMDKPLEKVSAVELLEAMQENAQVAQTIMVLPEKKKVELETEPVLARFRLRDLVQKFQAEKKKAEYEVEPGSMYRMAHTQQRLPFFPEWKKAAYEVDEFIPKHVLDPMVMESLVTQLETRLVDRLQSKGMLR